MDEPWDAVLPRAGLYRRNALRPHVPFHAEVELTPAHFTRWPGRWAAVVDERHSGKHAKLCKIQAILIDGSISRRLGTPFATQLVTAHPLSPDRRLS
jgi:hemoglobin